MCIWVTIFIERWRRKSSEIALRWGVLDYNNDLERGKSNSVKVYFYFRGET